MSLDAPFQLSELMSQFGVGGQYSAQMHERAHDGDIDQDGALAPEHTRKHGYTLFRKNIRQIPAATTTYV